MVIERKPFVPIIVNLILQYALNSLDHMNMEHGMYTPAKSPVVAAGPRGKNSASILLHDEEQCGKDPSNFDGERPAEYESPMPEELEATQNIDGEKVVSPLNNLVQ